MKNYDIYTPDTDSESNANGSVIGKIPSTPQNADAEIAIISAMIQDNAALIEAAEFLEPEDFIIGSHRYIFMALQELYNHNLPVDFVTLGEKLKQRDDFEKVGGAASLARIASSVSTSANVSNHISIVLEKSILRKLITTAKDIIDLSSGQAILSDTIIEMANQSLLKIAEKRKILGFAHIQDVLIESVAIIEKAYKLGSKITGIESGFKDLDFKTAGFHPSDLVLIAARPSMGKTAMALNMAAHAAIRLSIPVAIFSLEMSKESLATRLIASEAKIEANKLRTGELNKDDWDAIANVGASIAKAPIYIDDTPGITIPQLRSKCRKLKLEKGLGLILIDYLQLMSGSSNRFENRQQEISEISRSLKAIAREMNAPLIALSQLSRAPEARADRKPILSDLRESGAIEQDADLVCFIYRDEYYNPETEKQGIAEIIVAKQRNGATGTVELQYQGQFVRFTNLENHDY